MPARTGTLVVPTDVGWMIQRGAPDPTSGSLREADATIASLQTWHISGLRLKFRATFATLSAQPDGLGVFRNGYAG